MRFAEIAGFVFAFCLSLSLLNNVVVAEFKLPSAHEWIAEVNSTVTETRQLPVNPAASLGAFIGDFFNALSLFLKVIAQATILFYPLLLDLGLPPPIAAPIALMVYFTYIWGFIQFIRGMRFD